MAPMSARGIFRYSFEHVIRKRPLPNGSKTIRRPKNSSHIASAKHTATGVEPATSSSVIADQPQIHTCEFYSSAMFPK